MSAKKPHAFISRIGELYESGWTYAAIAAHEGVAIATVQRWLKHAGVKARPLSLSVAMGRRHSNAHLLQPVVSAYLAGESELSISNRVGVSRTATSRLLRLAGIQRRNGSEANALRMARLSVDERAALTEAAHHGCATARQQSGFAIGFGERELASMLAIRGIATTPQFKVSTYNIDLAVYPVAIEVHAQYPNPLDSAKCRKRIGALAELTWASYYIWIRDKSSPISDKCIDHCANFVNIMRRGPGTSGIPIRVVTSDGIVVHSGVVSDYLTTE